MTSCLPNERRTVTNRSGEAFNAFGVLIKGVRVSSTTNVGSLVADARSTSANPFDSSFEMLRRKFCKISRIKLRTSNTSTVHPCKNEAINRRDSYFFVGVSAER